MRTRLECDVHRRALRLRSGVGERFDLGVLSALPDVVPATDDLSVAHDDGADCGIRAGLTGAFRRFREGFRHERVHLLEEGVDKGFRIEGQEVFRLFADADITDGETELAADGYDNATLGCAVEFR